MGGLAHGPLGAKFSPEHINVNNINEFNHLET